MFCNQAVINYANFCEKVLMSSVAARGANFEQKHIFSIFFIKVPKYISKRGMHIFICQSCNRVGK